MEKRLPIAIVVHLARAHDHTVEGPEVTYTDNLSAHGACVISACPWKIGETAEVTSLNDRVTLHATVVYCHRRAEGRYNIGLYFQDREVTWNPSTTHASPQVGAYHELIGSKSVRSA